METTPAQREPPWSCGISSMCLSNSITTATAGVQPNNNWKLIDWQIGRSCHTGEDFMTLQIVWVRKCLDPDFTNFSNMPEQHKMV